MRDMRVWFSRLFACLMALVATGCFFFFLARLEHPYQNKNARPLTSGWTYYTDSDSNLVRIDELLPYVPLHPEETMFLSQTMNEDVEHPALMLRTSYQRIRVLMESTLIYENKTNPLVRNPGCATHFIHLSEDYRGKELRIEISSPYSLYAYSPNPIYMGDIPSLEALALSLSARSTLLVLLSMFSGCLFLLFVVVNSLRASRVAWSSAAFGVFSILIGLSTIDNNYLFQQVLSPLEISHISMSAWMLFPIPIVFYLQQHFTKYRKQAMALLFVFVGCSLAAFLLAAAGIWDLPEFLVIANPVYILLTGILCILLVVEWINRNRFIRFISPAFLLLFLSAVLSAVDIHGFYEAKEWCRVLGLVLLMCLVWLYHIWQVWTTRVKEREELRALHIRHDMEVENHKQTLEYMRRVKLLQHEFRHHTAAMQILGEQRDFEKLTAYLGKLTEEQAVTGTAGYCENPLVNSILMQTAERAKRQKISFQCHADLPEKLRFSDNDLCSLFMNLLDNAVEACQRIPEDRRWITLQVQLRENFLVITCQNAKPDDVVPVKDGRLLTTKPDNESHGYGIAAMNQIVERYDSKLNIDYDETTFTVKTILRLKK